MDAEVFAEWLRCQGHRVLRTHSSFWFDAGFGAYQAFPYHWLVQPSEQELGKILVKSRALALRYSAPLESPLGCISYHAVYQAAKYSLEILDRRSRQNVRTGLNNCRVEPISLRRLAEEGWALEKDTVDRQSRKLDLDESRWHRRCNLAARLPGFEAWGAIAEERLVASLLTFQMGDCCEFLSQQCHHEYLGKRVNNALTFVVTQTMVNRPGISLLFYAFQSLDASPSVDEFKFRMGYVARPVRQRVVLHPWLAPMVQPALVGVLKKLSIRMSVHSFLPKLVGMLRFYLEGQRPLDQQAWPVCLHPPGQVLTAKN